MRTEEIIQDLRRRIIGGEFAVSGTLPRRHLLLEHYDASNMTVQRAINQLAEEGFLVSRGSKGIFLSATPPNRFRYALVVQPSEVRMEIKDALSYLRMIVYRDDLSFARIVNTPKRNMGKRRMDFLKAYAEEHGKALYDSLKETIDDPIFKGTKAKTFISLIDSYSMEYEGRPVSEVLSKILNDSGYEETLRTEGSQERLDNLAELKQSVYEYETTCGEEVDLENYLRHIAMFTNADAEDGSDKVKLMTVHAAKGLEFPYVFLCGMNEGIFPSRKVMTKQGMEEERRLAFVAVTRAEKELYLSEADGRNLDGSPRYPSRFIINIDQKLLRFTKEPREGLIKSAREYIDIVMSRMPEDDSEMFFEEGQRVRHSIFGEGTVTGVDMEKGAHIVVFDEIGTPRRISFKAKLEKI